MGVNTHALEFGPIDTRGALTSKDFQRPFTEKPRNVSLYASWVFRVPTPVQVPTSTYDVPRMVVEPGGGEPRWRFNPYAPKLPWPRTGAMGRSQVVSGWDQAAWLVSRWLRTHFRLRGFGRRPRSNFSDFCDRHIPTGSERLFT